MTQGKHSPRALAAPVYLAAGLSLAVGVIELAWAMQPGKSIDDYRPTDRLLSGLGALIAAFVLYQLGRSVAGRATTVVSLVVTASLAVGLALLMLFLASTVSVPIPCLVLAAAFAYAALLAVVRLVRRRGSRPVVHS